VLADDDVVVPGDAVRLRHSMPRTRSLASALAGASS